jgi:hypothetical protein
VHGARGVLISRSQYQLTIEPELREQTQRSMLHLQYVHHSYRIAHLQQLNQTTPERYLLLPAFPTSLHRNTVQYKIPASHSVNTPRTYQGLAARYPYSCTNRSLGIGSTKLRLQVSPTCDSFHQLASQYYFYNPNLTATTTSNFYCHPREKIALTFLLPRFSSPLC